MSAQVTPSRLELRLEAEIAAAPTMLEADCKRAERAAYLARLGRFDEARRELGALHERYATNPNVKVSVWLNLADGLLAYFSDVGVSRTDKVQRAYALSVAAGLLPLRSLCAAWLAQWDYVRLDMDSLAAHVAEALRFAGPMDHAARARACLVAAQALHLAGRPDLANLWYRKSRESATADGDEVTLSALMHNMAWLHMLLLRQLALTGKGDPGAGRFALINAESNAHFDEMVGDSSWQELKPILRAQIISLLGNASEALGLYEEHLDGARAATRLQGNLLADKAWCCLQVGQTDKARECAAMAEASLIDETQIDDRAAAHSRLAQVFDKLGEDAERVRHQSLADVAWESHASIQTKAIELLSGLEDARQAE